MGDLDVLFSPLELGPVRLRNRIVSTSHQTSLVHGHVPTADLAAYHAERARGGAALIVMEATAVHPTGLLTPHTIGGYLPEVVPAFRRVAEAVQPHGTRLFAQFLHSGRELMAAAPRPPAVAPSAVPSRRYQTEPRALTAAEIGEMIGGFRRSAAHAREAGLDGVEVCAGFGYLPTQFLSPRANRRRDRYGGPFENRLRFLREALEAMRGGIGAGAVGARLSADERNDEGPDPAEVVEAAAALARDGLVDYVSVTLGASPTYAASTYIVPPAPIDPEETAAAARAVRAAVAVPVIATGRIADPGIGERLLRAGDCDAVGMTRALIADPRMPEKARAGRPITRCIGCNQGCIGHYHAGVPIACTVNPWAGYERTLPRPAARPARGTTVVVGAGPAGCAAAAAASGCGERVVVLERANGIGGQMRLALAAPGHAEVAERLLETLGRWVAGADVHLSVDCDAERVLAERPARVVLATGAGPYRPELDAGDLHVLDAFDALAGGATGEHVVVADWGGGWTGAAAAEALAAAGRDVRLALAAHAFGEGMHQYQRNLFLARLDRLGVELLHHLRPLRAGGGAVVCDNVFSGREVVVEGVDTLVVSAGRCPDDRLFEPLAERGVEVERVGDVLGPRGLEEAIREGTLAGLGARDVAA